MERKLKTRDAAEKSIKKVFERVENIYKDYNEKKLNRLLSSKTTLNSKFENWKKVCDNILAECEDDQIERETDHAMEFELFYNEESISLCEFIETKSEKDDTVSVTSSLHKSSTNNVKLPKISIKRFDGDPTAWRNFIDSFECTVEKNENLSNVEKMSYLINYLTGEAQSCIEGLSLCNDNYQIALGLLKERYGDKQILISSHMNKLLELNVIVESNNTKDLRSLYDHVNAQVRSLQSIGLNASDYGPMLIPVLMSKLPHELKLLITRQFGKGVWDVKIILESLKSEIETREKLKITSVQNDEGEAPFSGSSLYSSTYSNNSTYQKKGNYNRTREPSNNSLSKDNHNRAREPSNNNLCVYCEKSHKSNKCVIVTKVDSRKFILRKSGRCFLCLRQGHIVRDCPAKMKCFKCEKKHHVSVCDLIEKNVNENTQGETNANVANVVKLNHSNAVLLQTAHAFVYSTDEKYSANLRILFDSGSMNSFITPRARKMLNLQTTDTKEMTIKVFGGSRVTNKLDVVNLCVKSKKKDLNIYLSAYVNDVCQPLANQEINFAKENYPYLLDLELADFNHNNSSMDIDILIGADYYWQFIENHTIRSDNGAGPVALASKLGFILSGPIMSKLDETSSSANFISSIHVLKVENEILNERKELQKTLNNFWSLESLGISPEEYKNNDHGGSSKKDDEVLHNFNSEVNINTEGRFEVKLPFKVKHEQLHDNYQNSKNRLRTLSKKFKENLKNTHVMPTIQASENLKHTHVMPTIQASENFKNTHVMPTIQASEKLKNTHVMPTIQASENLKNTHVMPTIQASENLKNTHVMPTIQAK